MREGQWVSPAQPALLGAGPSLQGPSLSSDSRRKGPCDDGSGTCKALTVCAGPAPSSIDGDEIEKRLKGNIPTC